MVTVVTSLRDDPLGRLRARRQIDDAQYHGGRIYQALHNRAHVFSLRSLDPMRDRVSGVSFGGMMNDQQRHAAKRLHHVDMKVANKCGADGLSNGAGYFVAPWTPSPWRWALPIRTTGGIESE
jgi:hypothetical protein